MNAWILIIAMYSPGGDYMDKTTLEFNTQKDCESVRAQLAILDTPLGVKHKGICVTKDHWTGKKPMKGIALD